MRSYDRELYSDVLVSRIQQLFAYDDLGVKVKIKRNKGQVDDIAIMLSPHSFEDDEGAQITG